MPDRDHVTQKLIERQENMKYYHDRNAHDLSPLATGQHVRIQDHNTKKWIPGTVKYRRPEPHSYIVQTESGSNLRHNRRHLRPSAPPRGDWNDETTISGSEESSVKALPDAPKPEEPAYTTVTPSPINDVTPTPGIPTIVEPYQTRSGRAVIKPSRFAE